MGVNHICYECSSGMIVGGDAASWWNGLGRCGRVMSKFDPGYFDGVTFDDDF